MAHEYQHQPVTDEERRDLLKALGVVGAVATGSATLDEVRTAMSAGTADELAPVGQAIGADLAGEIDATLVTEQQAAMAEAAAGLPAVVDHGLPTDSPREEFAAVAAAGRPVYDHLADVGFFESTTEHLPEVTPQYLETAVTEFVGSEALSAPLADLGFTDGDGVDILATVIGNAEELSHHHWVATDKIPREKIEVGEAIPPVTKGAAGGILLWLEDLDKHLWQKQILISDEILRDAAWYGQSMAAGFHLMLEGAKAIAAEDAAYSEAELSALLATGFAVEAIAQAKLTQDVYWITDEMRAPAYGGD